MALCYSSCEKLIHPDSDITVEAVLPFWPVRLVPSYGRHSQEGCGSTWQPDRPCLSCGEAVTYTAPPNSSARSRPPGPDSGIDLKIFYSLKNTAFNHLVPEGAPAPAPTNPTPLWPKLPGCAGTAVSVRGGPASFSQPGRVPRAASTQMRW